MTLKEFQKKIQQADIENTNNYEKENIYFEPLNKKYDKLVNQHCKLFFEIQDAVIGNQVKLTPEKEEEWEEIELNYHKMYVAQRRMHHKIDAYFDANVEFDDLMDDCKDVDFEIEIVAEEKVSKLNEAMKLLNALTLSINKLDKEQIELMEEAKINYDTIIKFRKKIKILKQ